MSKFTPPPIPTDPVTLFYPVDSEQLTPAALGLLPILLLAPVFLLLALFSPAILLYLPVVILEHWLTGCPLDFDLHRNAILPTPEELNK
jgi:hypothetical protein